MSASLELKSKEEKDAELDRRIEALRRKNEALIKRYQEIEEDRKKAEQEGVAVTGARRPRSSEGDRPERRRGEQGSPVLSVQLSLSPGEKRVVSSERRTPKAARSPAPRGSNRAGPYPTNCSPRVECPPELPPWEGLGRDIAGPADRDSRGWKSRGRAGPAGDAGPDRKSKEWEERRRQNIEKMNEEMEQIAEYERSQRDGLQEKNPVRSFLDDPRRSGPFAESDRRDGSRRHIRNWGGPDFDKVRTGLERGKDQPTPGRRGARRGGGDLDMTLSMTGRERAEYVRWKQEREQIDRERLARHRQPTGQWRREWDAEKSEAMFKEAAGQGTPGGRRQAENARPPKPPTFGEFLSEHRAERRRKGRGRGGTRGPPPKPYSMHDNRWEKEEPAPAEGSEPSPEEEAEASQGAPPTAPTPVPEEDEDQWEDVEEEEEEGGSASSGSSSQDVSGEEDVPPPACSPKQQRPPRPTQDALPKLTMPLPGRVPGVQGKPLSPFSPAEGYQPVPDWGEEMELSSPRAGPTESLPPRQGGGILGSSGLSPPAPLAVAPSQQSPAGPMEDGAVELPKPDLAGAGRDEGVAAPEPAEQDPAAAPGQEPVPGSVEITAFQRDDAKA